MNNLSKKEKQLIIKSIKEYWLIYNDEHEDNLEDFELSKSILKKLKNNKNEND